MGSVFFTGQTIRYVGSTPLTVSETVLSAAPNVNTMFSGEDPNAPGLIKYVAKINIGDLHQSNVSGLTNSKLDINSSEGKEIVEHAWLVVVSIISNSVLK